MAANGAYYDQPAYAEPAPAEAAPAQPAASLDYDLDEIERLAELKDKGIISEAEFTAKKKEILGL